MVFKKLSKFVLLIITIDLLLLITFSNKNDISANAFPLPNDTIVSSKICDSSVKQYSGYLNITTDANMFFWFFESRNNPKNSPLTIWLSGGPGISSMAPLFEQIGPCTVDNTNKSILSVNSWNNVSNLLFIDQPIGVGFSYGTHMVNTSEQAASDIYNFLQRFFTVFPQYASLDLHLFSESYGGHYGNITHEESKLIMQNNNLINNGKKDLIPINLKSCGIAGAWVDPAIQMGSYINFAENNTYKSLLDQQSIKKMSDAWIICKHNIAECYKTNSKQDCTIANITCKGNYFGLFVKNSGVGVYDIRTKNGLPDSIYRNYLEKSVVLNSIGVNTEATKFTEVDNKVYSRFADSGDIIHSMKSQVEFLLDNNIPIMFYTGDADFICNWMGGNEMAESLKWKRHQNFKNATFQEWTVDGVKIGEIRKVEGLWFVKVFESGHLIANSQPKNSLELFKKWIKSL
ncbi:carboxypeptidase S1, CPD-S1 [Gigaspora rosea]|uniref:Carboxypeptidase n=1 Tax=Gigaspora rosea TaxID=44941 RepID=A0A397ULW9_9GLOM|nr:carboxypeptidase S1, CPD-S1 [Gigaspora rosea]